MLVARAVPFGAIFGNPGEVRLERRVMEGGGEELRPDRVGPSLDRRTRAGNPSWGIFGGASEKGGRVEGGRGGRLAGPSSGPGLLLVLVFGSHRLAGSGSWSVPMGPDSGLLSSSLSPRSSFDAPRAFFYSSLTESVLSSWDLLPMWLSRVDKVKFRNKEGRSPQKDPNPSLVPLPAT